MACAVANNPQFVGGFCSDRQIFVWLTRSVALLVALVGFRRRRVVLHRQQLLCCSCQLQKRLPAWDKRYRNFRDAAILSSSEVTRGICGMRCVKQSGSFVYYFDLTYENDKYRVWMGIVSLSSVDY